MCEEKECYCAICGFEFDIWYDEDEEEVDDICFMCDQDNQIQMDMDSVRGG